MSIQTNPTSAATIIRGNPLVHRHRRVQPLAANTVEANVEAMLP